MNETGPGNSKAAEKRLWRRSRFYTGSFVLQIVAILLTAIHNWLDNQSRDPFLTSVTLLLICSIAIQWQLRKVALGDYASQLSTFKQSQIANWRTEELFGMTDMLQAAETYDDAGAVLMATARRLMPDHGVALYVFNNSRDRLDLARSWDLPEGYDRTPRYRRAIAGRSSAARPTSMHHQSMVCAAPTTAEWWQPWKSR